MSSYPKSEPNYMGVGMRRLYKSAPDIIEAYDDFLIELSKETGRNFCYEFNEYFKNRLSAPTAKKEME